MRRIRIGLVGAGFIGVAHANAIEAIVKNEFVAADFQAVCDTDVERARAIAESFGAKRAWTDAIELIRSGEIDTVFICTPTRFHRALVEAAAEQGLSIFCEKPLACSFSDAQAMYSAVAQAGVKNQVGLVLRYSPIYNVIRHLISGPGLGRPMSIIFRDDQYFPIRGIYGSTWRCDVAVAGGGTLIEHSIHDADILRWLFGEITGVRGEVKCYAGYKGIEDLAVAQFQFENGSLGQLTSAWHNITRRESNRYMEIFFENGFVSSSHDFFGTIGCQLGDEDFRVIPQEEVSRRYLSSIGLEGAEYHSLWFMQGLEDYHFLHALETGATPHPDFEVAVKAHEIVEAIYRSSRNNSPVRLPL
ncbi:MAG: Gfo/Idh/MocA family oxidoreductase [Candidatus Abyssubacteria bacterium]